MMTWTETCVSLARLRGAISVPEYMRTMARLRGWKCFSWRSAAALTVRAK